MVLSPSCLVPVDVEFPRLRTTLFLQLGSFLTQTAFILPRKQKEMGIQFHLSKKWNRTGQLWEGGSDTPLPGPKIRDKPKNSPNPCKICCAPQNQPQQIYRALLTIVSKRVLVASHCPPLSCVDVDKTSHGISGRPLDPSPLLHAAPTCGSLVS